MNQTMLQIFFVMLISFYAFLFCYTIYKLRKLWKTKQKSLVVRSFFQNLIFVYLQRIVQFTIIYTYVTRQFDNQREGTYKYQLFLSLDMPRSFLYVSYLILYALHIISKFEQHYEPSQLSQILKKVVKSKLHIRYILGLCLIPLIFAVYNTIYLTHHMSDIAYTACLMIGALASIVIYMWLNIKKHFRFSGNVDLEDKLVQKTNWIKMVFNYWFVVRILELFFYTTLQVFLIVTDETLDAVVFDDGSAYCWVFYFGFVIQFLVCEFLAGLFCLDKGFIEQFNYPIYNQKQKDDATSCGNTTFGFLNNESVIDKKNGESQIYKTMNTEKLIINSNCEEDFMRQSKEYIKVATPSENNLISNKIERKGSSNYSDSLFKKSSSHYGKFSKENIPIKELYKVEISQNNFIMEKDPLFSKENGLGKIYEGKRKGNKMKVRQVPISQISHLFMTDLNREIAHSKKTYPSGVEKYLKSCHEGNLYILSEYHEDMVNLIEYFKISPRDKLSQDSKIEQIQKIVEILIELKENSNIHHGHLTPHNILITKDSKKIQICDVGQTALKKYSACLLNYMNKSQFSCPQTLEEKGNVALQATEKSDVYSLGMIMWFMFREQIPFHNLSSSAVKTYILDDRARPKIPENLDESLSQLVRVCWQQNPENRPTLNEISEFLKSHTEKMTAKNTDKKNSFY